ncbi:phosphoribosylformylglycinamidine synthase subunit PurS [Candidatus Saccharibacteria bacterium]|nr:phosphoribosylformylglycinamidine synthase subunit PurS [Candidatus Saccharibacteria bacterium]
MSEAPFSGLRIEVLVLPKEGMLDPEGEAVELVLKSPLGFNVNNVRIGRLYELVLPQDIDPTEACRIGRSNMHRDRSISESISRKLRG